MVRRFYLLLLVPAIMAAMVAVVAIDPDVPFLLNRGEALWIRAPRPVDLQPHEPSRLVSVFRKRFRVDRPIPNVILEVGAVGVPTVWFDGQLIWRPSMPLSRVRTDFSIDIASLLTPGEHELRFQVERSRGYPLLLAYCEPLRLMTDKNWEVGHDGKTWTGAWTAARMPAAEISREFPTVGKAVIGLWRVYVPVFVVAFILAVILPRSDDQHRQGRYRLSPGRIRWILIALWTILGLNNIMKIPLYVGMDALSHYDYIVYVWEYRRVPVAAEGWQMFQPPLFYIISAPLFGLFKSLVGQTPAAYLLRSINLLCGLLQVELCYRATRYVFPDREDLRSIGTIIGGLLPMNIYMSQVVGNEPPAALFASVAVVICLKLFSMEAVPSKRSWALPALAVGLSVLTKPTAVLLIPPILMCLAHLVWTHNNEPSRKTAATLVGPVALFLGIAGLVSGWYYIRNYIVMGHFFVGGWDPAGVTVWWQYPSFRTLEQITTFGESLSSPVYSAVHGIWDSLYSTFWADGGLSGVCAYKGRPPWNYDLMLSTLWFSILPALGIGIGSLGALAHKHESGSNGLFFAAVCVAVYMLAVFYLFLVLPIYSTAKATYTLGLTPCYAVLAASGLGMLVQGRISRAMVIGLIACWAVGAYGGFFVI